MGAPLTPISPMLRHRPPNSLCHSVARNCRFPCQGNEIVGKVWGREGKGNAGGRQNWCPRQSVTRCFFLVFSARDFFWNFRERKKMAGNSPAGPPIAGGSSQFGYPRVLAGTWGYIFLCCETARLSDSTCSLNSSTFFLRLLKLVVKFFNGYELKRSSEA